MLEEINNSHVIIDIPPKISKDYMNNIDVSYLELKKRFKKENTFSNLTPSFTNEQEITKEELDYLRKIMQLASESKHEQIIRAKKYKRNNNVLKTLAQVLSTLAGSTGLGSLLSLKTSDPAFWILLIISSVSLSSAVMSTLMTSLDYEKKASVRKNTASDYSSVITKIAQFISTPGADRKDIEIFTNSITIEMNVINSQQEI